MAMFEDPAALARAEAAARRASVLSELVHRTIEAAPDPSSVLASVADALVPTFADGSEIDVVVEGRLVRVVRGVDPDGAALRQRSRIVTELEGHPILEVLRGGPARLLDIDDPEQTHLFGPADEPTSARALGMTSAIVAPLLVGDEVVGTIAFGRGPSGRRFEPADVDVAVDLGRRIATAWHNAARLQIEQRLRSLLTDVQEATSALSEAVTADDVGRVALARLSQAFGCDRGAVWEGGADVRVLGTVGDPPGWADRLTDRETAALAAAVGEREFVVFVDHDEVEPTIVATPLLAAGAVVGAIMLAWDRPRELAPGEHELLATLSELAGQALQRASLYDDRARDIADLVQARHELDAARRRNDAILASLQEGLLVTDSHGIVIEVNDHWCEMTGFAREECLGATIPYPWWPSADDDPAAVAALDAAASDALANTSGEYRVILKRVDGTRFPAVVAIAPLIDRQSSDRVGVVTSVKDLTHEVRAEADLAALQRSTVALATARGVRDVGEVALHEAVTRLGADAGGYLAVLSADGQHLEPLAVRIPDGAPRDVLTRVAVGDLLPRSAAVRDGVTIEVPDRDDARRRFPGALDAWLPLGVHASASVPLPGPEGALGALTVWWSRPHRLLANERALLEAFAAVCAQVLQRARIDEVERQASATLQHRMLADAAVLQDGVTIGTRYQPGSSGLAVGGDWYDVVNLDDGRLALSVGDVVGSGIHAAAVMGQLRSALKGIALTDPDPARAISALDRVAHGIRGALGTTVCFVVLDPDRGVARFCRAGHPPPLLLDGGGARFLMGNGGPPLGVSDSHREAVDVEIEPGSCLLLFTDGLVERRQESLTDRLEVLRVAAESASTSDIEDLLDHLVAACSTDDPDDDVAVLAVCTAASESGRFHRLIPARAAELAQLRAALRVWLDDVGAGDVRDDVVLAASEAATNAIEHAYLDVRSWEPVYIAVSGSYDDGEVVVEIRDAGRWKPRPSDTSRGRGLAIARAVMDDVRVRSGPSGTTVTLRRSLEPAITG